MRLILALPAALALTALSAPPALACAPGNVLNLTNWKLQLPVDNPNQPGTQVLEITQPALKTYSLSPWFVAGGGGVRFRNAINGVTTPNTKYARSIPVTFTTGYFKAGVYPQANCTNSTPCNTTNYAQTTIHNLRVTHT